MDTEGRVHGAERLSVVDASIMPDVPSGFTHFPTIMIAKRLSERLVAGVDDMRAMVVGGNVIDSGHRAAQRMVAADDQPQLFARIQCQPDREQVDVHAGDLSGGKLLDAIKAMGRHAVRGVRLIEMAKGRAQATVGAFGSEPSASCIRSCSKPSEKRLKSGVKRRN